MAGLLDYFNRGTSALTGSTGNYGGLLSDEEQKAAQQQAQLAMAAQLLDAGGWSPNRTSFGQALGRGIAASGQARQSSVDQSLQAALLRKQIAAAGQQDIKAIVDPTTGKPKFVTAGEAIGKEPHYAMQRSEAPAVLQEYAQYSKDEEAAGRKPQPYMDWYERRAKLGVGAPFTFGNLAGGVGAFNKTDPTDIRQVTTAAQEGAGAGTVAAGTATGKGEAERRQVFINEGLAAADSLPVINRAIDLLDSVGTGGIDAAKLAATNFFGVTGADETELSNNLGKAVLSQLRSTFGAAFTEREGERLQQIEANFGKSTEGNKRLMRQAKVIVERAARRGIKAAQAAGDDFSAEEIERSMNMTLAPKETEGPQGSAPAAAIEHLRKNPQLKDAFKTKYGYLPPGF